MQQTFFRLMRLAHWVIGAFILTTLTFFAATGFMLNHGKWFEQEPIQNDQEYTLPETLPLPELSNDPNAPTPALAPALIAWLAERMGGDLTLANADGCAGFVAQLTLPLA